MYTAFCTTRVLLMLACCSHYLSKMRVKRNTEFGVCTCRPIGNMSGSNRRTIPCPIFLVYNFYPVSYFSIHFLSILLPFLLSATFLILSLISLFPLFFFNLYFLSIFTFVQPGQFCSWFLFDLFCK
jgi:hypothetical protein